MSRAETTVTRPAVTQRRILLTWLPLAASWLLMALEMPYMNAALARLSEAQTMIAAFGLVASLSITIESPVISLLATSTALARSRQNYEMLRRYTIHLILGTTLLHYLLGYTALFDLVVVDLMGVPVSLHEPTRLGLQLMMLWSAAIAWRRFKQGVLIRYEQSRYVGSGTLVRLLASAGTATLVAVFTDMPGVAVGALGLSAGVVAEAIYAQIVAAPLIKTEFYSEKVHQRADLAYGELASFHWPLAASNLLFLLTQPLIAAALARAPRPELALAAWPVLGGLLFIMRSPSVALPEVVIALEEEPGSHAALKRFGLTVGLLSSLLLVLVALTPLSDVYFRTLIGVDGELAAIAALGASFAIFVPFAMSQVSVYRGLLTAQRITRPMALAMAGELLILSAVLVLGLALELPGVPVAAVGLTLALGSEAIFLNRVSRTFDHQQSQGRIMAWFFRS